MKGSRAIKKIKVVQTVLDLSATKNDRAFGIMAGAFLEHLLGLALRARMREMKHEIVNAFDNHGHGALATFSQKLLIGYALNMYPADVRAGLIKIKDIRNHFAHEPEAVDFEDDEIKPSCMKLWALQRITPERNKPIEQWTSRERYFHTVLYYAERFDLIGRLHI